MKLPVSAYESPKLNMEVKGLCGKMALADWRSHGTTRNTMIGFLMVAKTRQRCEDLHSLLDFRCSVNMRH